MDDNEINRRLEALEAHQARADDDRSRLWDIVKAFFAGGSKTQGDTGVKMQLGMKTWATLIGLGVIQGSKFIVDMFFN
jgi:hypothetical protein